MLDQLRDAARRIPKGKVSTYGAVARAAGFPGRARQVVWALQKSRGVPWHRVVGAGGRTLLPGERGFEQRLRLAMEGVRLQRDRVDMAKYEYKFTSEPPSSRERPPPKRRR